MFEERLSMAPAGAPVSAPLDLLPECLLDDFDAEGFLDSSPGTTLEATPLTSAPRLDPVGCSFPLSSGTLPEVSRTGSTKLFTKELAANRLQLDPLTALEPHLLKTLDASSNSGGDLADGQCSAQWEDGQDAAGMRRHRERNRAAQKRFRQRQKARMATSAQQLDELVSQMQQLKLEKQRLEAQNRVLQHTVRLSSHHIQDTAFEKEAFGKQQERILMETKRLYWRGIENAPLTLEDTKKVSMEAFLKTFEHFLGRFRAMLENGGKDPTTPAGRELRETVLDRRHEEARVALFSHWASACYAWNKEETSRGMQPPSLTFWTTVLDTLELSQEQQAAMLMARKSLLKTLTGVQGRRERIILELGVALLQKKPDASISLHKQQLRDSLEFEREAVLDFMYTIVDCTLHPWQEAAADLHSHPWHPDLWAFCNILAVRKGAEAPDISAQPPSKSSLLPHFSAADMLWTPILSRGAGLQMKRVLASRETPDDPIGTAARPTATISEMRSMTMYEIFCGKHLEVQGSEDAVLQQPHFFAPVLKQEAAAPSSI